MSAFFEITTPDGPMPTYSVSPHGDVKGAVIVIQEAFGVTQHICDIADRLAAAGYRALAPALFHRDGGSPTIAYDDIPSVYPLMQNLSATTIAMDVDATIAVLQDEGFDAAQIGMVGFCMGGAVTLFSSTRPGIGAGATFYGGGLATGRFGLDAGVELGAKLSCPWIGHFGDLDQGIPVEEVEQLRAAVATSPIPGTIYRYAEADHGFNCNDRPGVYNADAAALAWERTIAFFDEQLARH